MKEQWKDISGYEGLYMVSNLGRIKSMHRWKRAKCPDEYFLKMTLGNNGYVQVTLYKNNSKHKFLVHRLVAEAFVPNDDGLQFVNHKDENRENNAADNLEWCTVQYNNNYGTARFRQMLALGSPVEQRLSNGQLLATYTTSSIAEAITGISRKEIAACIRGDLHSAGGFVWSKPM